MPVDGAVEVGVGNVALRLVAVLGLVILNGFFVASEFALVAVRRSRVDQLEAEGHPGVAGLRTALDNINSYLAAAQLGITVASLALGWIGEPALASLLDPLFHAIMPGTIAGIGSHIVATALAFFIITTLHIVLGEQAPKLLALQRSESTAMLVARPTGLFLLIFSPFIWVLNATSNFVLHLFGLRPQHGEQLVHSVDELRLLVAQSREAGALEESEEDIVERALELGDTRVHQVMVPRTEVAAVDVRWTLREAQETIDHVVGVTHVRDILLALQRGQPESAPASVAVREAMFVPETAPVDDVLAEMRRLRRHFAVVVEEHGGTAGIVTIEDLLEAIVGDIGEEFQPAEVLISALPEGGYVVDGLTPIDRVNEALGIEIDDPEHDTIGGFVTGQLGKIGAVGDVILAHRHQFRVEAMVRRRIGSLRVTPTPRDSITDEESRSE